MTATVSPNRALHANRLFPTAAAQAAKTRSCCHYWRARPTFGRCFMVDVTSDAHPRAQEISPCGVSGVNGTLPCDAALTPNVPLRVRGGRCPACQCTASPSPRCRACASPSTGSAQNAVRCCADRATACQQLCPLPSAADAVLHVQMLPSMCLCGPCSQPVLFAVQLPQPHVKLQVGRQRIAVSPPRRMLCRREEGAVAQYAGGAGAVHQRSPVRGA